MFHIHCIQASHTHTHTHTLKFLIKNLNDLNTIQLTVSIHTLPNFFVNYVHKNFLLVKYTLFYYCYVSFKHISFAFSFPWPEGRKVSKYILVGLKIFFFFFLVYHDSNNNRANEGSLFKLHIMSHSALVKFILIYKKSHRVLSRNIFWFQ